MDIYKKRTNLIIDYISQILVYGSNTNGNIGIRTIYKYLRYIINY